MKITKKYNNIPIGGGPQHGAPIGLNGFYYKLNKIESETLGSKVKDPYKDKKGWWVT